MNAAAVRKTKKRVVTIGGGTGHFTLLSGLKQHDVDITAVVSMADDGGSTGLLRDELGVLPPGDLRQCLVALSEGDGVMRQLFTHRFSKGSLKGHMFGNLFISTLEQVTGSIEEALGHVGDILKIQGRVLPVTLDPASLLMKLKNGKVLRGEHVIDEYQLITRFGVASVTLAPRVRLNPEAKQAILDADLVVLGPGDFYTSLLPNLLVSGMGAVLAKSRAHKLLAVNLMNKYGHTDEWTCDTYASELERHTKAKFVDTILYNTTPVPEGLQKKYVDEGEPVVCTEDCQGGYAFVGRDVLSAVAYKPAKGDPLRRTLIRHDPDKLARAVLSIIK